MKKEYIFIIINYAIFFVNTKVNAGQKIQIFFDVSSINNPPGPYRKTTIQYEAYFVD